MPTSQTNSKNIKNTLNNSTSSLEVGSDVITNTSSDTNTLTNSSKKPNSHATTTPNSLTSSTNNIGNELKSIADTLHHSANTTNDTNNKSDTHTIQAKNHNTLNTSNATSKSQTTAAESISPYTVAKLNKIPKIKGKSVQQHHQNQQPDSTHMDTNNTGSQDSPASPSTQKYSPPFLSEFKSEEYQNLKNGSLQQHVNAKLATIPKLGASVGKKRPLNTSEANIAPEVAAHASSAGLANKLASRPLKVEDHIAKKRFKQVESPLTLNANSKHNENVEIADPDSRLG